MATTHYLLVPDFNRVTSGYGHIIRCLRIALDIAKEYFVDILLSLEQQQLASAIMQQFTLQYPIEIKNIYIVQEPKATYDGVIIDKREVRKDLVHNFLHYGPIIGIDSGGEGREYVPYLIDTLPNTLAHKPNLTAFSALISSAIVPRDNWPEQCQKILYYTNGYSYEDEQQLVIPILSNPALQLTVISTATDKYSSLLKKFANLTLLDIDLNFIQRLPTYDLLIIHFGITAFEAIAAKVPVILCNKTKYHQHLSEHVQFPMVFYQQGDKNKYLTQGKAKKNTQRKIKSNTKISKYLGQEARHAPLPFVEYITTISNSREAFQSLRAQIEQMPVYSDIAIIDNHSCISQIIIDRFAAYKESQINSTANLIVNPWLGLCVEKSVYRDCDKTIFRCSHTKQYHQISFMTDFPNYNKEYFFSKYKEQYGNTYLEDYANIAQKMRARMCIIEKHLAKSLQTSDTQKPIIFDLGSAYGIMLELAAQKGFWPLGIEINSEAVEYCNNTLNCKAIVGDLINESIERILSTQNIAISNIAIYTAFFLLEHLPNIQHILSEIHTMLPINGMFVCAVPNGSGISSRIDKVKFFCSSPIDHFSIFTPRGLSTILEKSGFKIVKIAITGHHPERFGFPKFLNALFLLISKVFRLGDTFEIYATKHW